MGVNFFCHGCFVQGCPWVEVCEDDLRVCPHFLRFNAALVWEKYRKMSRL